ncbi:MAG: hypothetical protein Q4F30_03525 [Akkermansia sp.]|nr:hypothetical protein [Akkermansia sp.]
MSTITINLDTLDSTEALQKGELIFQEECNHLVKKIQDKVCENYTKTSSNSSRNNSHGTITDEARNIPSCFFIDGARGSGKSTLLRAVRAALLNNDDNKTPSIYPLADVDPTELGKGENFFIHLLGRVYKILEDSFKEWNINEEKKEKIHAALENLRQMSSGLQVLMDADEALKKSDTPDFFLENCIDKCASSVHLRKKLDELLDHLSKITRADVFLVTIDDADLNFSKCEDVLEYIRKYMQSPRLIFIFAGDMQLYSHIVRGMQLNNFGEKLLNHDTAAHNDMRNMLLDSMEEQYLMKIFPVDNRIKIQNLKDILENSSEIYVKYKGGKEDKTRIQDLIQELMVSQLNVDSAQIFSDLIYALPLRSFLFLLRYLTNNPENPNSPESAQYIWKGIQEVATQSLNKFNINFTQEGAGDIESLYKNIFRYYSATFQSNSDLALRRVEGDDSVRRVALFLSGAVSQATKSLSSKLKYWCSVFPVWQRIRANRPGNPSFTRVLIEHYSKQEKTPWENLACSAMIPENGQLPAYQNGLICLLNENSVQDFEKGTEGKIGFQELDKELLNYETPSNASELLYIAGINACLCRVDDNTGSFFHLSIYHLLMHIAEWLDLYSNIENGTKDEEVRASALAAIKAKLSSKHTAPAIIRIQDWNINDTRNRSSDGTTHVFNNSYPDNATRNRSSETHVFYNSYPENVYEAPAEEIYQWLQKYGSESYTSFAYDFQQAWDVFISQCAMKANNYSVQYRNDEKHPKAGKILKDFMTSVHQALGCLKQTIDSPQKDNTQTVSSLADSVKAFPMWKALMEKNKKLNDILDTANIGDMVDLTKKEHVLKLKRLKGEITTKVEGCKKVVETQQSLVNQTQREIEELEEQTRLAEEEIMATGKELDRLEEEAAGYRERSNRYEQQATQASKKLIELSRLAALIEKSEGATSPDIAPARRDEIRAQLSMIAEERRAARLDIRETEKSISEIRMHMEPYRREVNRNRQQIRRNTYILTSKKKNLEHQLAEHETAIKRLARMQRMEKKYFQLYLKAKNNLCLNTQNNKQQ